MVKIGHHEIKATRHIQVRPKYVVIELKIKRNIWAPPKCMVKTGHHKNKVNMPHSSAAKICCHRVKEKTQYLGMAKLYGQNRSS